PTWADMKQSIGPILRGTAIGSFFGVLPGTGPAIASFSSYIVEKKVAADPSRFGRGAIEGVAGPESANNADAHCKVIPMLTLGLPASGVMALMLGALTIQGIQPGPEVMTQRPELFWGLVASMWIGNLMLVVLNLPLIGVWVKLLTVPYRLLFPAIMAFSAIGIYSVNNSSFEIYRTALFRVLGFVWTKLGFPAPPLLLGFVLGPMMEEHLRRAMLMAKGDPTVFVTRPISLAFIVITALVLVVMVAPAMKPPHREITGCARLRNGHPRSSLFLLVRTADGALDHWSATGDRKFVPRYWRWQRHRPRSWRDIHFDVESCRQRRAARRPVLDKHLESVVTDKSGGR